MRYYHYEMELDCQFFTSCSAPHMVSCTLHKAHVYMATTMGIQSVDEWIPNTKLQTPMDESNGACDSCSPKRELLFAQLIKSFSLCDLVGDLNF